MTYARWTRYLKKPRTGGGTFPQLEDLKTRKQTRQTCWSFGMQGGTLSSDLTPVRTTRMRRPPAAGGGGASSLPPQGGCVPVEATSAPQNLDGQAPVTPEWPENKKRQRSPLPRRRPRTRSPLPRRKPQQSGGHRMASDPRVYGGTKEAWKVESKLQYRAKRKAARRRAKTRQAAEPSSDRCGRRRKFACTVLIHV